ncbi:helix-turn-helix domain-containing protein [uncultured Treponema sp.]|uniref:helix-turn-helix domain-containing protein n=1 Tax=uncultured Treponema sp. TaxID=162155 RepID=UPI00280A8536|nr:helix-turn-helix domain-containing protein [uncultured Treponema sp.]
MSYINEEITKDILTASEASEILGVSKQRLSVLIAENKIHCKKQSNGGLIILRQDIEEYMNKDVFHSKKLKDLAEITSRSLEFYKNHKSEIGEIYRITIYANAIDAIHDGNYEKSEDLYGRNLYRIDVPYMIIKGTYNEMWLSGCKCGYCGTGASGSVQILEDLGIDNSEGKINSKIIEYNKINGKWILSINRNSSLEDNIENKTRLKFFTQDGKLILVQDDSFIFEQNIVEILNQYKDFMPNPYSISFIRSDEEAIQNGYFLKSYSIGQTIVFKLILEDKNKNQIWFPFYHEDNKSVYENPTIKNILEYCGFETKELTKYDKIKNWINLNVFNKQFDSDMIIKGL